jgi:hypothetical protein
VALRVVERWPDGETGALLLAPNRRHASSLAVGHCSYYSNHNNNTKHNPTSHTIILSLASCLVPRDTTSSRAHSYHYLTSLIMSLPEGAFPRLNASMVHSGAYTGSIASVVGKAISFDGEQTVELECVDGGRVQIITSPDFSFVPGMIVEIMGAVQEDKTVQVSIPFPRRFRLCCPPPHGSSTT